MKKYILTTALLMIYILSFSQNNNSKLEINSKKIFNVFEKQNIWVLDTILGYTGLGSTDWELDQTEIVKTRNNHGLPLIIETTEKITGTSSWINVYQGAFSYFSNDTVNEYKVKEWNTQLNNWNSDISYYDKYDETGKKLEHFIRYWDNDYQYFYQGNKEIYTYDINGYKTIKEEQDWFDAWVEYSKTFYYNDINGNDTLEMLKIYVSGQWQEAWETKNTYNEQNQLIFTQQRGYDSYFAEWFDYSRTTYTYTTNGLPEQEYTESYNSDLSKWEALSETNYYYNADKLISYKEELDLFNTDNSLKYEYTYNTNLDETSFFLYSNSGGTWTLFYKVYDTYDANFNQTSYYSQSSDGTWANTLKEEYFWNNFETSNINSIENNILVYPNPSSKILNIKTSEPINIKIFNINGKLILNTNQNNIDISMLKKGIYLIEIKNKKNTATKKIIVN